MSNLVDFTVPLISWIKIGLAGVRDELAENQIPEPVIEKLLALLQIEGTR